MFTPLAWLLYRILAGRLPYDIERTPVHRASQVILSTVPIRLSRDAPTLRGDLETIALKALEKERARRYQTALDFRQDIEHYLQREPIRARPASVAYQARMFVRRHRSLALAAAGVMAITVLATIVSSSMWLAAARSRDHAVLRTQTANEAMLLIEKIIQSADPFDAAGSRLPTLLDEVAAQIESVEAIGRDPEFERILHRMLGRAYRNHGRTDDAREHLQRALELARQLDVSPVTLRAR